jgi:hypothetical protein
LAGLDGQLFELVRLGGEHPPLTSRSGSTGSGGLPQRKQGPGWPNALVWTRRLKVQPASAVRGANWLIASRAGLVSTTLTRVGTGVLRRARSARSGVTSRAAWGWPRSRVTALARTPSPYRLAWNQPVAEVHEGDQRLMS